MQPKSALLLAVSLGLGVSDACASPEIASQNRTIQTVAIAQSSDATIISFQGLSLATLSPSRDGMEAALSFRQPVAETLAADIQHLAPCISDAASGYDSMLLRTRTASRFDVRHTPGGFVLTIHPAGATTDDRRSATIDIRRLTMLGETETARNALADLRKSEPDDAELVQLEGDIQSADHDYRAAAATFASLLRMNPSDEGLRESLDAAHAQYAPRIETGVRSQKIEKADRQTHAFAEADIPLGQRTSLRGRVDYVELDDDEVQNPDATTSPFSGQRFGGELDLVFDIGARWHAALLAFGNESSLGGGALIGYEDASSAVELKAVLQQPVWDYPESIVANGTVDAASLAVTRSFDDSWFFNASASIQRFSLYDINDAAIDTAVEAGIQRALWNTAGNRILLSYNFDADFVNRITRLPDGSGGFFALLPLADRTIHSTSIRYEGHFSNELATSIRAGYENDAQGQDGLIASAELTYAPTLDWKMSINTYYSGIGDRAGQSGAYMNSGLTITRIFVPAGGMTDEH